MNLFWAIVRIMTTARRFESVHRFKTLLLCAKNRCPIWRTEVVFPGTRAESFPLREMGHDVSLRSFAAPTALQTSAV
jgi:hypothetical protein